jgi:cytidine deaminase
MFDISSLTEDERRCLLRFLYHIARSDYKIVPEEIYTISAIGKQLKIDIVGSESWLTSPWELVDANNLSSIMIKSTDSIGWMIAQGMNVMNADNIQHRNEKVAMMLLAEKLFGNKEYPKAIEVPVEELDEDMKEMLIRTPELCLKKDARWQKKKKNEKAIKRVGASLSWSKGGKRRFVTAVNYELTTPGGSRCAEQNAIGLAIAKEPQLKFEEINNIVIFGGGGLSNPCWPCGVCMENLRKLNKANQIKIYGYPTGYVYEFENLPRSMIQLSVSKLNQRPGERQSDG